MKTNFEGYIPNLTLGVVTKILLIEVYFLLRVGKSPAYFSLSDFLDNYSIELLYISVLFFLLAAWIFPIVFLVYFGFAGTFAWFGRKVMNLIRINGVPVFRALREQDHKQAVSIEIAKDYAKSKKLNELTGRIEEYEKAHEKAMEGETLAATNFFLVLLIVTISCYGAPNFLMRVTSFADPFTKGYAYHACIVLLAIQGCIGRASSFYLLGNAGKLPRSFFDNEDERQSVAGWSTEIIERNIPLALRWMKRKK